MCRSCKKLQNYWITGEILFVNEPPMLILIGYSKCGCNNSAYNYGWIWLRFSGTFRLLITETWPTINSKIGLILYPNFRLRSFSLNLGGVFLYYLRSRRHAALLEFDIFVLRFSCLIDYPDEVLNCWLIIHYLYSFLIHRVFERRVVITPNSDFAAKGFFQ